MTLESSNSFLRSRRAKSASLQRITSMMFPFTVTMLMVASPASNFAQVSHPLDAAFNHTPQLRLLLDWVSFYQSFDNDTLIPDMAAGDWKVSVHGKPELAEGLLGKALVAGTGAVMYPGARNWTIATRGAVSFWLCPVHWDHRNAGNTNFLLSGSSALYLERQGPLFNPDGQLQRGEVLLFGLQQGPTGNAAAACSHWKDGEWHLIVTNWSWPRIELSVDGDAFAGVELRGKPDAGLFGDFMLGSVGGDPTLMDEVMLYRRPLTAEEARSLYKVSMAK